MATKLGQDQAFPMNGYSDQELYFERQQGMSKRFYAACAAMQGQLTNKRATLSIVDLVSDAYEIADELLSQENK